MIENELHEGVERRVIEFGRGWTVAVGKGWISGSLAEITLVICVRGWNDRAGCN